MRAFIPALRRVLLIIALLVIPVGIMAQESADPDQVYKFSTEELTQMLAPIALYPDALTAQILMASTYPLEVVEAERWISQNGQLKGTDLDAALQDKNWDPSVKSLCHFPDILKSMSDKLDQTRKLGDAFLGQEEKVMATIQELRSKAISQGTLKTTGEQKVSVESDAIKIEPVNPEVIYVPVYDPAYVYGAWWYPGYPPYYWYYPPGYYNGTYIGFGPGIYFGYNAFSWVWFDWRIHRLHTDIDRTRSFNHVRDRRDDRDNFWRHSPQHRRGVAYRDLKTGERFGVRAPRAASPSGLERRGYPGRVEEQKLRSSGGGRQRDIRQTAPQTPQVRQTPALRREGTSNQGMKLLQGRPQQPVLRDTPFRGVGEGSFERRAGERGGISTRSNDIRQQPAGQQSGGSSGGQIQKRQDDDAPSPGGGGSRGSERGGGFRRER